MGKKKVAVSLRKPSQADSNVSEAYVRDASDSTVFAAQAARVSRVDVAPRAGGAAIEAVIAVEDTPVPVSDVRATEVADVTGVIAKPSPIDAPQIPANDVVASSKATDAASPPGTRLLTIRIPERLANRLDAYCRKHDREIGSVIGDLVGAFLDGQHDPAVASPLAALRIVTRWIRFQLARILRAAYVPATA
ncbi:MAG: hypothetical protein ACHREM_01795 [Polyangiales bacterium]